MREYYRIMLGAKSVYASELYKDGYVGIGFFEGIDLTGKFPENWRDFNREFIPKYLEEHPEKSKVAAGLACGTTWTLGKGLRKGDIVICPNGEGLYFVGEVEGDYEYHKGKVLPHRRKVSWYPNLIKREDTSIEFQNSAGSIGTVCNVSRHSKEIENLIAGMTPALLIARDEDVEDPSIFALEEHLEDFLIENWQQVSLSKKYNIVQEDGELVGKQYPTDTGPIDILAISKDKKELLVIELKKGRATDVVIGQIQRYMGYVKEELAENRQSVKGIVIAYEDDIKLQRALSVTQNIDFYKYKVSFKLEKA
ncbi:MAG: endonuclease NucS [Candidatus Dojkabacteria bacterium]|nr:endonuclease NucS [Candidatus Dojkabacteria bacterium]MDD4560991.1 endonuclease NucS [Candidatus Dojkabacteria bacterium]